MSAYRTKVRITKSEISMRTWRSPMSTASQGAFAVIPEIPLADISCIKKLRRSGKTGTKNLFLASCFIMQAISHLDIACITTKIICAPAYTPICCSCKSSSSISRQAPHLLPISAFSHRVFKSVIWFARIKSRTSPSVFFLQTQIR